MPLTLKKNHALAANANLFLAGKATSVIVVLKTIAKMNKILITGLVDAAKQFSQSQMALAAQDAGALWKKDIINSTFLPMKRNTIHVYVGPRGSEVDFFLLTYPTHFAIAGLFSKNFTSCCTSLKALSA